MFSMLKQLLIKRYNLKRRGEDEVGQIDRLNVAINKEVEKGAPYAAYRYAMSKFLDDSDVNMRLHGKNAVDALDSGADCYETIHKIRITFPRFSRHSISSTRKFLDESVRRAKDFRPYTYQESDISPAVVIPDVGKSNISSNKSDQIAEFLKRFSEELKKILKEEQRKRRLPKKEIIGSAPNGENIYNQLIVAADKEDIEYIDKRSKGGLFWIVGGEDELAFFVEKCAKIGADFTFKKGGGRGMGGRDGWWTVSKI